jgi:hypothetical protein
MERRLEERRPCSLDARLTGLKNGETAQGQITNIAKSGICLVSSLQLGQGEVVQVELADSKLFGNIAYCHPEANLFRSGVEVLQVQVGGAQLSRLLETILMDSGPVVPEPTAAPSGRVKAASENPGQVPSEIHLG